LARKLIARAFLVGNAGCEFIVRAHIAGRLRPAGLLEIHHRRPVRDRNRQMATNDEGRYHDHLFPTEHRQRSTLAQRPVKCIPIGRIVGG
jgi:hypothetical protein